MNASSLDCCHPGVGSDRRDAGKVDFSYSFWARVSSPWRSLTGAAVIMPLPPSVGYGVDFNQARACFKAFCRTARTEQNSHLSLRIRFLLALSAGTPASAEPRCRPAASRPSADCPAVLSNPQSSPVGPVNAEPVSSISCPAFSMTIIMPADVPTRGGNSQRGAGYQSPKA